MGGRGKDGGKGGKPGESNEEAMLRLTGGKGGGGKGKGKGKGSSKGKSGKGKDGGPPSSDEIPAARRDELRAQLEAFSRGSEPQLAMPPTITGLERKYLHEVSQELGLTSQSFGQGRDRHLCIFKAQATSTEPKEADAEGAAANEVVVTSPTASKDVSDVTYSCLVLDPRSQSRLRELCKTKLFEGGIQEDWSLHCEHMTICMGPLSNPQTEDNRSVAGAIHSQIGALRVGQMLSLTVVSVGKDKDVKAVGVVGCTSCNKNPHVTVATAPQKPPSLSNLIRQWQVIPVDDQVVLSGVVWQRGGKRPAAPAPWAWPGAEGKEAVDAIPFALEAAVERARLKLLAMSGGRPKSEAALLTTLKRGSVLPKAIFVLHPAKLAEALGSLLPSQREVLARYEECLRAPDADPLELFVSPAAEIPADALERVKMRLAHLLVSAPSMGPAGLAKWLVSQASVRPRVDHASVLQHLVKAGALSVAGTGEVQYLGLEVQTTSAKAAAYLQPWPLERPAEKSGEEADEPTSP